MKNKLFRIVALLLVCGMMLPTLIACGEESQTPGTSATTTTTTDQPDQPDNPQPAARRELYTPPAKPEEIKVPAAGEYTFCQNEADANGMITLSDYVQYLKLDHGTLWYGNDDNSTTWLKQRMRNNYAIFLPTGSTFNCPKEYDIYLYDADMVWQSAWYTGEKTTGDNPKRKTGLTKIGQDCFVRFSLSDQTVLSETASDEVMQELAKKVVIQVPKEKINSVYCCNPSGSVDADYEKELQETVASLGKVVKDGSVNYIFITDLHQGNHDAAIERQLLAIVELVNRLAKDDDPNNDIDFICLGGDITTGMYTDTEKQIAAMDKFLYPLNKCEIPVMVLRGNHDDNSYYYTFANSGQLKKTLSALEAQNYLDEHAMSADKWYDEILAYYATDANVKNDGKTSRVHDSQNAKSAYYYYDFAAKKTRVVCLDAIDYGKMTPDLNGCTYWGYGARQLQWLAIEALKAPDGWNYVFLSHMGYEKELAMAPSEYYWAYKNLDALNGLLLAFQTKGTYRTNLMVELDGNKVPLLFDFTLRQGNGMILSYEYGHHHTDLCYYNPQTAMATMTIGTSGQYKDTWTEQMDSTVPVTNVPAIVYPRKNGTVTEALFDVISIDAGAKVVHQIRFGSGPDATYTLTTPDPTAEIVRRPKPQEPDQTTVTAADLTDAKTEELLKIGDTLRLVVTAEDPAQVTAEVLSRMEKLEKTAASVRLHIADMRAYVLYDGKAYDPDALARASLMPFDTTTGSIRITSDKNRNEKGATVFYNGDGYSCAVSMKVGEKTIFVPAGITATCTYSKVRYCLAAEANSNRIATEQSEDLYKELGLSQWSWYQYVMPYTANATYTFQQDSYLYLSFCNEDNNNVDTALVCAAADRDDAYYAHVAEYYAGVQFTFDGTVEQFRNLVK